MGRIISIVALLVAISLFVPLYNAKIVLNNPSHLEGENIMVHMVLNRSVLQVPPTQEASSLESTQENYNKELSGVEQSLNTISSELKPEEEKEPYEKCAIFGPFKEAKLEQYHREMEKVGISGRVLIEPVVFPTKIRLLTKSFTAQEIAGVEEQLTGAGIPWKNIKKGTSTVYQLGGEFTDIVKVETFLNRVRQKVPMLNVQIEREALDEGPMVQLVFLEMKDDSFLKVKKFVQEQGANIKACPY